MTDPPRARHSDPVAAMAARAARGEAEPEVPEPHSATEAEKACRGVWARVTIVPFRHLALQTC